MQNQKYQQILQFLIKLVLNWICLFRLAVLLIPSSKFLFLCWKGISEFAKISTSKAYPSAHGDESKFTQTNLISFQSFWFHRKLFGIRLGLVGMLGFSLGLSAGRCLVMFNLHTSTDTPLKKQWCSTIY